MPKLGSAGTILIICLLSAGCETTKSDPECQYSKSQLDQLKRNKADGDFEGQFQIASLYFDGTCFKQNKTEALKWFQRAAEDGHIKSQLFLATSYIRGDGIPKDPSLAAMWYEKAATQGNADAQFKLAQLYQNGIGVSQSIPIAEKWYARSALQGHIWADYRLCQLTPECSPPPQAEVVLKSLRKKLQREEQERQLAVEARRERVSELLGSVVVMAHRYEGKVLISKPFSQSTNSFLDGVLDATARATYSLFSLGALGLSVLSLDPFMAADSAKSLVGSAVTRQHKSRSRGLYPEQNKIAKDTVKKLRRELNELKPENLLQESIVNNGASQFNRPFTRKINSPASREDGETTLETDPKTSILINDMEIDIRAKSFWIDKYTLEVRALISVTNRSKRKSLIDTVWYKYTVHGLSLSRLAAGLEEIIGSACDGITGQLFAKIHDDAV